MEKMQYTAVGFDANVEAPGFAGVRWKMGDRTFSVWIDLSDGDPWNAILARIFEWCTGTSADLSRKDGETFFKTYFIDRGEILISGKRLNRRSNQAIPLDEVEEDSEPSRTPDDPAAAAS